MHTEEQAILFTKNWIRDVVIGCNFCPFASKVFREERIVYLVDNTDNNALMLEKFVQLMRSMDEDENISTALIIYTNALKDFESYLDFADLAEALLADKDYEGVYQVASFHPDYCFDDADEDDAANFTNRSIYPMLHILREEEIENALENFPDPDSIPEKNIAFAQRKGLAFMQQLRKACMES